MTTEDLPQVRPTFEYSDGWTREDWAGYKTLSAALDRDEVVPDAPYQYRAHYVRENVTHTLVGAGLYDQAEQRFLSLGRAHQGVMEHFAARLFRWAADCALARGDYDTVLDSPIYRDLTPPWLRLNLCRLSNRPANPDDLYRLFKPPNPILAATQTRYDTFHRELVAALDAEAKAHGPWLVRLLDRLDHTESEQEDLFARAGLSEAPHLLVHRYENATGTRADVARLEREAENRVLVAHGEPARRPYVQRRSPRTPPPERVCTFCHRRGTHLYVSTGENLWMCSNVNSCERRCSSLLYLPALENLEVFEKAFRDHLEVPSDTHHETEGLGVVCVAVAIGDEDVELTFNASAHAFSEDRTYCVLMLTQFVPQTGFQLESHCSFVVTEGFLPGTRQLRPLTTDRLLDEAQRVADDLVEDQLFGEDG